MKPPAPPPDLDEYWTKANSDRLIKILSGSRASGMSGQYLPWDKLRYKTPPGDLTHEEWWFQTKLARRSVKRPLTLLVDKQNEPFSYTLPDELLELVERVSREASGHISISEQVTNAATRDRYVVSSLIEEAITSSQLEGAATSRRVAKEMIRSGRPPKNRSERMILNNYRAMRTIVEYRDREMTPDLVCEIHRIVTDGTLDNPDAAGHVQDNDDERIAVWGEGDLLLHKPPPVAELPERLARLCGFANGAKDASYIPPVLRAVAIHFMVGYDHYFEDGNGRTARALFYWSMLREGFWLTEFLTISRILKSAPSKYAQSFLLTEGDEGDLTYFFIYNLGVIVRAIDDLHEYLSRKAAELRSLQNLMRQTPGAYNYRQLALLEHAVKNPDAFYTAASHALSHNVTQQSARNDLADLEERSLLVRVKVGRRHAWVPADELTERTKQTIDS